VPIVVAKTLPSIAYMTRGQDESWRIQLMNTDGSDRIFLSDRQEDETTPVWSPGADRLAFVSQRDGNREIYITDLDGSNVINFSNNLADDWTPAWSPDGTQIAFSSNRTGNWEIFIANVEDSNLSKSPRQRVAISRRSGRRTGHSWLFPPNGMVIGKSTRCAWMEPICAV
jgi:Tol biopolymer transport system component